MSCGRPGRRLLRAPPGHRAPGRRRPTTHLGQLRSELRHVALQPVLVAEGGGQLRLAPVEEGLQVPDTALGHRELTFPLLGTERGGTVRSPAEAEPNVTVVPVGYRRLTGCPPRAWEAEAGGWLQVGEQRVLQSEALSHRQQN